MIKTEVRIQNTEYSRQTSVVCLSDLIGKPYKDGGRGPEAFDCWGICMEVARRAGLELPELDVPADNSLRFELINRQRNSNFRLIERPEPFCIALFRIWDDSGKEKWHVGIVLPGCRKFCHTTGKMGVNIPELNDPLWRLFIEGFYRYRIQNTEGRIQ